jgi:hypothetical protein
MPPKTTPTTSITPVHQNHIQCHPKPQQQTAPVLRTCPSKSYPMPPKTTTTNGTCLAHLFIKIILNATPNHNYKWHLSIKIIINATQNHNNKRHLSCAPVYQVYAGASVLGLSIQHAACLHKVAASNPYTRTHTFKQSS